MGMFDSVYCEYPLPGAPYPDDVAEEFRKHGFQSKSLNCNMDVYRIDADGFLWSEKSWLTSDTVKLDIYTGSFYFYTYFKKTYYEFQIVFVKGKIVSFERTELETDVG